jgi:hypothetical protein
VLGVMEMALILVQSMVELTLLRSVCHGKLWLPNQSYLRH